jgi:hypothetical protein
MKQSCLAIFILWSGLLSAQVPEPNQSTVKPWTIWWWMGNAINREGITAQLEKFAESGIGGVSIVPIYGVKGAESEFLEYLSPTWQEMLQHALEEAERLNLEAGMTLGTGWPYGGPWIPDSLAARKMDPKTMEPGFTVQKVKRAAPGGNGLVLDYYNHASLETHLAQFEALFSKLEQKQLSLHSIYHDSFEAFGANWTFDFEDKFRQRWGYDLLKAAPGLLKNPDQYHDTIHIHYQNTIDALLKSEFTAPLSSWCRQNNTFLRNQAHGSPANILDLYALAGIPETEIFGYSNFRIPGLRQDTAFNPDSFGQPDPLVMKFASSAAHLTGKKLVSSETATWLGEHFRVALSQVKPQVDELFTAGINHIFYHGAPYNPPEVEYPGWLFYASTNFGTESDLWPDLPELNRYIANCQQLLQNSLPDHDILLYFPIYDLWSKPGPNHGLHQLTVHHPENWLHNQAVGNVARQLWKDGFTFDFISDSLLQQIDAKGQQLQIGGNNYRAILVPPAKYLPLETGLKLQALAANGATVIYLDHPPFNYLRMPDQSETEFKKLESSLKANQLNSLPLNRLNAHLEARGIVREKLTDSGLQFIRRQNDQGSFYFISNKGDKAFKGWLPVAKNLEEAVLFHPVHQQKWQLNTRRQNGQIAVNLEVLPGESVFILQEPANEKLPELNIPVQVSQQSLQNWEFALPEADEFVQLETITGWTDFDPELAEYSGVGIYRSQFDVPESVPAGGSVWLVFEQVNETAEIILNEVSLGKVWAFPFRIKIPLELLQEENLLEVRVRNLGANRIAGMDRRQVPWKKFYDINLVNIKYRPFDASGWPPMPSGLNGPVKIVVYR